jgi:DNA-binding NarL/FixJ family response regulator
MHESEQAAKAAVDIGARGLLLKSDAARDLDSAVAALQNNSTFFSAKMSQSLGSDLRGSQRSHNRDVLTRRERQVVQLLAEGKSTKEVASVLDLSVKTAETHRSNIMGKLGLHSVSELVMYAVRNNIVQAFNSDAPVLSIEPEPAAVKAEEAAASSGSSADGGR